MNNLEIFRAQLLNHLQSTEISSLQQWHETLSHLCNEKVLSPTQIQKLNKNSTKRSFPITIKQFQQIIMNQFGDQANKQLIKDIDDIQKNIRETKGVLAVWKEQGMTKGEIKALQVIFSQGNSKMKEICGVLKDKKILLESVNEPQIQMIQALDEWVVVQKVVNLYKNYTQYQQINQRSIEALYNQLRVREVHFRTKRVSKANEDTIHSVNGFNSKTDEQVQVVKIPKKFNDYDKLNTTLVTFNAERDLMLSEYFVRFLGCNTNADPNYYFYFREYIESKNLKSLIQKLTTKLSQTSLLFKYWCGEIFNALKHMFYYCSYSPILPIKLQDIEVSEYGLKITVKHVKFDKMRQNSENIEPELLANIGKLILELLGIQQKQIERQIRGIQNKSLIYALLKARDGLSKYESKIVNCYIHFNNAQTHPLFETVKNVMGLQIMQTFSRTFGDL